MTFIINGTDVPTKFKEEYRSTKSWVLAWRDRTYMADPEYGPYEIQECARVIYNTMHAPYEGITCDRTTLKQDYDALMKISDSGDRRIIPCIPYLKHAIKEIVMITDVESIVQEAQQNPLLESGKDDLYHVCIADYSFKLLLEVFHQEVLGDALDNNTTMQI